jgi:predicted transcriptional regulator
MTKLLEHAMETARNLPPEAQDEIARMVLIYAGEDQPPVDLTPEEEAAVLRSREAAARGEFATDEEMQAIWSKKRP